MQDPRLVIHDDATITPFWHRLPRFFLFPLQTAMLLVLVPLSLASLLGFIVPLPMPLDFFITEALVWLAAFRHAFGVLDRTAMGLLDPMDYDNSPPDPDRRNLPWKMLGVSIVWGFIIGFLGAASPVLGMVGNVVFMLAFPAIVMALTVTNSLWQAANPLLWGSIIRAVGKAYIALFIFLMLLSGGGLIVVPMLGPLLRSWLALPLLNFVFLYFNLIMFNMMGYVLYQYHRELGLPVLVEFGEAEGGKPTAKADPVGDEIARLIAQGNLDGAIDAAYEQQRTESDDVAVQDRYHKLLVLAGKKDRALDHGRRFMAMLVRTNRGERAIELFNALKQVDENFAIEEPGQVLPLAEAARRSRDYALALTLMRAFDKRHPRHPDVPGVYMLSAKILCEHFRKDDLAAAILQGLRSKFPNHPLAAEAGNYLVTLEKLRQVAAPA